MMKSKILFVTGTDTAVGKTMVSLLVMRALAGHDAVYLKPVQTGCMDLNSDSDPAFLHRHLPHGLPHGMTPADCIHLCRIQPKAPLFAGESADRQALISFVAAHAALHQTVVVEGAGGILVPITRQWAMLDLARDIEAQILVVARAGLGTINHTLLTLGAIKARSCPCLGVIFVDPTDAVPELDRAENAQAITLASDIPVWGVIGRQDPGNPSAAILDMLCMALNPFLN